jgi:hypothetical protein
MSSSRVLRQFSHASLMWVVSTIASSCRCAGPSCCKLSVTTCVWFRLEPILFPFLSKPFVGSCNGLKPISLSMKLALGFFGYDGASAFSKCSLNPYL